MNRNLNIFLWIVFFALMAPSGMVLASWNAVPGDSTYGLKIGLEKVLLFALSPSNELESTTNSKLTERRLGEVSKVLSGVHAKESLDNLTMQIAATRESLNGIEDKQAKKEAILKYIDTLHQVTSELENQKRTRSLAYIPPRQQVANYRIPSPPPGTSGTTTKQVNYVTNYYYAPPQTQQPAGQVPPAQPVAPVASPTQTTEPVASPEPEETITPDVVEDITDTQDDIEDVIDDLTDIADDIETTPDTTPTPDIVPEPAAGEELLPVVQPVPAEVVAPTPDQPADQGSDSGVDGPI